MSHAPRPWRTSPSIDALNGSAPSHFATSPVGTTSTCACRISAGTRPPVGAAVTHDAVPSTPRRLGSREPRVPGVRRGRASHSVSSRPCGAVATVLQSDSASTGDARDATTSTSSAATDRSSIVARTRASSPSSRVRDDRRVARRRRWAGSDAASASAPRQRLDDRRENSCPPTRVDGDVRVARCAPWGEEPGHSNRCRRTGARRSHVAVRQPAHRRDGVPSASVAHSSHVGVQHDRRRVRRRRGPSSQRLLRGADSVRQTISTSSRTMSSSCRASSGRIASCSERRARSTRRCARSARSQPPREVWQSDRTRRGDAQLAGRTA
jgi:hypothetical protein